MTWFLVQGYEFGGNMPLWGGGLPALPPQIGGGPSAPPVYPSQGPIYGGGYPSQGLPNMPGLHPGHELPGQGGHPWLPGAIGGASVYAGVQETKIPERPNAPNPEAGEWVLVALGDRTMQWAWMNAGATPK